ncbi:peptidoglycan editing factor PgeF [Prochlorococcus sp. AH-736-M13]|nr:peptidoglycan editing factor PgeF [Prochlorococcus sp. AH-736-M13]MDA9747135.1 peptidoglycan editing factor PgeF [Prochlorococcus sp. AH-736-M13]
MPYKEIYFSKDEICIQNKKFEYYSSPILSQNNFKHAYFMKSCSEKFLQLLGNHFNENSINYVSNQIHSNVIVFASNLQKGTKTNADGLVSNKCSQNLWVYTADCMPIFFADTRTRTVATLHCGRKGLEKKIIKNLVKIFDTFGTSRDDLLVAIGPAISKEHYLVDKMTLKEFYRKAENKNIAVKLTKTKKDLYLSDSNHFRKQNFYKLDLKRSAYRQLVNENIPHTNIDISNLCTYELNNEFYSWRRSKTISRQWNLICS